VTSVTGELEIRLDSEPTGSYVVAQKTYRLVGMFRLRAQPSEGKAMHTVTEIFLANPMATTFGAIGLLCQLIWPMFRRRRAIMTAQFGVGADYSLHYALLDAWSGAGVAGIGATQSALAFFFGERSWFRWLGLIFLPVVAAICYATWAGLETLFAFAAVTLIMLGRLQRDTLRLRILLLAAAPFGIGYDILVGAPALVGGIVSATVAATMLVREINERRQPLVIDAAIPALSPA
jgi:hypothetical protein